MYFIIPRGLVFRKQFLMCVQRGYASRAWVACRTGTGTKQAPVPGCWPSGSAPWFVEPPFGSHFRMILEAARQPVGHCIPSPIELRVGALAQELFTALFLVDTWLRWSPLPWGGGFLRVPLGFSFAQLLKVDGSAALVCLNWTRIIFRSFPVGSRFSTQSVLRTLECRRCLQAICL